MNPLHPIDVAARRPHGPTRVLLAAMVGVLAATLSAHGGQYRGPTSGGSTPATVPGGGPTPGLVPGGPLTGGNATLDLASWRVWWGLNGDAYVRPDSSRPVTDDQRRQLVLPSLKAALDATDHPDINSACLIAIGKAAVSHPTIDVLDVLRQRMDRSNVEVREAAVLAMGLSGRSDAFDDLDAVLRDTPAGRKLVDRSNVGDRARTFAAYALGMLAQRSDATLLKTRILGSLVAVLEDPTVKDRDVLIGVLNGLRLLGTQPDGDGAHKRLLWMAVDAVEKHLDRRLIEDAAAVQSHGLTALAALLGRGDSTLHQRAKDRIVEVLQRRGQDATTYVSAVIALGKIAGPDDAPQVAALVRAVTQPADSLVPKFGMIAMGEIGGEVCRAHLERAFEKGKRDLRPWAALGLGLLAFHDNHAPTANAAATAGTAPPPAAAPAAAPGKLATAVGALLHERLRREKKEMQAAIAIGLGLADYKPAAADLRQLATKYLSTETLSGPVCLGLAMMEDAASIPIARDAMRSVERPVLFGQAGLALARFAELDASSGAVQVLAASGSTHPMFLRRLAAAAQAIGHLRNPDDIAQLAAIVADTRRAKRDSFPAAFAAAALGSVADRDPVGFGTRVAQGMNYTTRAQTISNGSYGILDIF